MIVSGIKDSSLQPDRRINMIISGKQIFIYEGGLFIVLLNPGAKVCGASNETQLVFMIMQIKYNMQVLVV